MRVLVIPAWYPNGEDKLMGIYHKEFTRALNRFGIKANMLYIDRQKLSKPIKYLLMKKKEVIKETNYFVYIYKMLDIGRIGYDIQMKSYTHTLDKAFKDYLKNNPMPDILHAQVSVPTGYATCILGKKYGIPVVVTEHGGKLERFYKDAPYRQYGEFVLNNSYMTTVSKYMQNIVLKYTEVCEVIPNQIDTSLFKNDIKRKIEDEFRLISVCALREGKNLDIAFKAIRSLIDKGMKLHYDIIGDGFLEDYYKKCCDELDLNVYVSFLGRKEKTEIPKYLSNKHALLISSELESFAIPGVEALASGLPVITTDCLGPVEFVDEYCGEICKVNDPEDMARAIKYVYDNYSKYDKTHMKRVAKKFSEEAVVKKAKEIYEQILSHK